MSRRAGIRSLRGSNERPGDRFGGVLGGEVVLAAQKYIHSTLLAAKGWSPKAATIKARRLSSRTHGGMFSGPCRADRGLHRTLCWGEWWCLGCGRLSEQPSGSVAHVIPDPPYAAADGPWPEEGSKEGTERPRGAGPFCVGGACSGAYRHDRNGAGKKPPATRSIVTSTTPGKDHRR